MPKLTVVLRPMLLLAWAVAASSAVASASPRSWHPRKFARGDGGGFERERGPTPASRAPDRLVELTPSSEDTGLPSCGLHLFRHVSKTGGTTIRFVFDKNTAMGEWEYPLVYGFKREQWDDLVTKFRQAAASTANAMARPRCSSSAKCSAASLASHLTIGMDDDVVAAAFLSPSAAFSSSKPAVSFMSSAVIACFACICSALSIAASAIPPLAVKAAAPAPEASCPPPFFCAADDASPKSGVYVVACRQAPVSVL
ncbi:hypothetical protein PPROV_000293900 [Pycnococcus provasolii]|uniref:Uncharacterized protein n=1 Tax=Pycnococcus provasolii TaxID=41880 RepID=A0A830HB20_9CHLO|nr:hypothetical protein PPROV_000293900 [Pycnococcus provasolii]